MSDLLENSRILIFASDFKLLPFVVMVKVYEKIWPCIDMYLEKGKLHRLSLNSPPLKRSCEHLGMLRPSKVAGELGVRSGLSCMIHLLVV